MGSLVRRWRWFACLALAAGCALNPQPDLPSAGTNDSAGGAGGPPVISIGGSSGTTSGPGSGATGPGMGAAGASLGVPEGGEGGDIGAEGGAPPTGEAGQAGSAEAGALGLNPR